tara:strand:- start:229 stop:576 length:348 start_codon:yes stop_codon:yes gene_type:complete
MPFPVLRIDRNASNFTGISTALNIWQPKGIKAGQKLTKSYSACLLKHCASSANEIRTVKIEKDRFGLLGNLEEDKARKPLLALPDSTRMKLLVPPGNISERQLVPGKAPGLSNDD